MTPEQMEVERAEFEAWYRHEYWNFSDAQGGYSNGQYEHLDIQLAWASRLDRAEKAHAERREMQEIEQRLRAEIARLQAIADRAVPDGWREAAVGLVDAYFNNNVGENVYNRMASLRAMLAAAKPPSESPASTLGTMQIWDIFQQGKWWAAMVAPLGWDAHCVKEDMERQGYSSELTVAARKVIAADANPVVALMARNAELEALLATTTHQDSTP